jgi:hypothetical protein
MTIVDAMMYRCGSENVEYVDPDATGIENDAQPEPFAPVNEPRVPCGIVKVDPSELKRSGR